MGATSSVLTAQQISIQCREATWENISCVLKGQGEKWQLAVRNSSTLLSYWLCPWFWLLVALFGSLLGHFVNRHQATRMCGGSLSPTAPQTCVFSDNHSLCLLPGCCCSRVGQVQREAGKDSWMKQTWREDLSAPCLSTRASGESVSQPKSPPAAFKVL